MTEEQLVDMSAERNAARREMKRGLTALLLEVPEAVARDLTALVYKAVTLSEHEAKREGYIIGTEQI